MLGACTCPYLDTRSTVDARPQDDIGVGARITAPRVGIYFGKPDVEGRRPLLRRQKTAPDGLRQLRQLHDRLRPQRQEQATMNYLYLAEKPAPRSTS